MIQSQQIGVLRFNYTVQLKILSIFLATLLKVISKNLDIKEKNQPLSIKL